MTDTGLDWQRSSFCSSGGCIEVAATPAAILVRDSTVVDVDSPVLAVDRGAWRELLAAVRAGTLARPA